MSRRASAARASARGVPCAGSALEKLSLAATRGPGAPGRSAWPSGSILVWGLTGPIFGYSDTWQLVINTGTTIVTFLMVFLIQRAQNKESKAIHLKLNEIVAAMQGASNHLIDVEDLSEEEIEALHESLLRARPPRVEARKGARVPLDRGSAGTERGEDTRAEESRRAAELAGGLLLPFAGLESPFPFAAAASFRSDRGR